MSSNEYGSNGKKVSTLATRRVCGDFVEDLRKVVGSGGGIKTRHTKHFLAAGKYFLAAAIPCPKWLQRKDLCRAAKSEKASSEPMRQKIFCYSHSARNG
jgi:hypothetical protein